MLFLLLAMLMGATVQRVRQFRYKELRNQLFVFLVCAFTVP
jgi:hypothetical protein